MLQRQLDALAKAVAGGIEAADLRPRDLRHLDHHLAHRRRLHALQCVVEIVLLDRQVVEHLVGDSGFIEVDFRHQPAHRLQRRLARQRRKIGADEAVSPPRKAIEVDAGRKRHAPCVNRQDFAPAALVGDADDDLAVEPSRSAERFVEGFGAVGRRDHHQILARLDPVHQRQQLGDQPFLGLALHLAALGGDRVDLVDEDDRGRLRRGLLEQFAQPLFTFAIGGAHDFGSGDMEEMRVAFIGDRAGEARLAGAGRPMQQHALGRIDSEPLEDFRMPERQLDHLAKRIDGLAHAAKVVIGDVGALLAVALPEFGQQLDLGVAVDVDDPLGGRRHRHQPHLLQRECRRVQHLPDVIGHFGVDALVPGGGDDVAFGDRPPGEAALERTRGALQPDIVLRRREYHAGCGLRLRLADLDEIAGSDLGVGPLQPVEPDDVEPLVRIIGTKRDRRGRPLADNLDSIALTDAERVHQLLRKPRNPASTFAWRQVRNLHASDGVALKRVGLGHSCSFGPAG
jgi:hypothetical protein